MEKCQECASIRICNLLGLYKKTPNCNAIKKAIEEKLPGFLRNVYQQYRDYSFYFKRLNEDLINEGDPLITDLSKVNYDFAVSLMKSLSKFPWILFRLDKPVEEIIESLIIVGQLFDKRKTVIFIPFSLMTTDFDKNFFLLNQAGLTSVIVYDNVDEGKFFDLAEKWIQYGMIDLYPYCAYFRDYFSRLSGMPALYFVNNLCAYNLFYYLYKDRSPLKGKLLLFYLESIDRDILVEYIKKAYFSTRGRRFSKECILDDINLVFYNLNENLTLVHDDRIRVLNFEDLKNPVHCFSNRVIINFSETDYTLVANNDNLLLNLMSVTYPSEEVLFKVGPFDCLDSFYYIVRKFIGYQFGFYVDLDTFENKEFMENLIKMRRPIFIELPDESVFVEALNLIFGDKKVDVVVEPFATLFDMFLDGTKECNFLNSCYPDLNIEKSLNILSDKLTEVISDE
ncbi:MAG: hypothetical protein QXL14_01525 [Candidatus Aenigmatarchaeota archaeon]